MSRSNKELLLLSIMTGILTYTIYPLVGPFWSILISVILGLIVQTKFFVIGVLSLALWMILFKVFGVIISIFLVSAIIAVFLYFDFYKQRK